MPRAWGLGRDSDLPGAGERRAHRQCIYGAPVSNAVIQRLGGLQTCHPGVQRPGAPSRFRLPSISPKRSPRPRIAPISTRKRRPRPPTESIRSRRRGKLDLGRVEDPERISVGRSGCPKGNAPHWKTRLRRLGSSIGRRRPGLFSWDAALHGIRVPHGAGVPLFVFPGAHKNPKFRVPSASSRLWWTRCARTRRRR